MFNRSLKVVSSNFSLFWKIMLYKLIVFLVILGSSILIINSIFQAELESYSEFIESIKNLLLTQNVLFDVGSFFSGFIDSIKLLLNVFIDAFVVSPFSMVALIVLFAFVFPFLWNFNEVAVSECLYGSMASQTKYGFIRSFVRKLGDSFRYSILYSLIILPIICIFIAFLNLVFYISSISEIFAFFSPFLLFVSFIVFYSLTATLLKFWTPAIVVNGNGVICGFKQSFRVLRKRFWRIFSNYILIDFVFVICLAFFGFYGAIVLLPLWVFVRNAFAMVSYFEIQGTRYYLNAEEIYIPKRMAETDSFSKLKNII